VFTGLPESRVQRSFELILLVSQPREERLITQKNNGMKSNNTFGVHFALRANRTGENDNPVYARITVNGTICEFSMKQSISKKDWNTGKGEAKPKKPELRAFNSYLQETQGVKSYHADHRSCDADHLRMMACSVIV
jgi:hypothetical protein